MYLRLLLLVIFGPVLAAAQRAPDPERAAVEEVITTLGQYFQAGDMAAAETLFWAGGMHILTDDATTHGWVEYRDQHLEPELALEDLHYAHTRVEPVIRGSGDRAPAHVEVVAARRSYRPVFGLRLPTRSRMLILVLPP